ncbi:hypothetical protein [Petrachloros mirabilis]
MTTANGYNRLSLLSKIGLVLLVGLISLVSLLFYLQTRHGFRHVIIPLAAKFTGAKIEAEDGFLSFSGALEIEGLVYKDPASKISFDAKRMALRAAPWSIFSEGVPKIDDLQLKKANLRVVIVPGAEEVPVEEREREPSEAIGFIPVAVEHASFEELAIVVQQEGSKTTARVNATLDQLGPGRAGSVKFQTGFLLERGGTRDLSGTVDLALTVEIGSGGTPIKWNGSNRILFRTGRGQIEPSDPEVFNFAQTIEGEYAHEEETVRVSSNVAISKAGKTLGTVELTASRDGGKHPSVTDASLTMAGITGETLNVFLGGTGPTHVHAGRFDARFEAHIEGPQNSVRGTLTGSAIRLKSGKQEASPPINVSLQHMGSFDSATKDVAIETLTLSITDSSKTLLSGALDRPVSLRLERTGEGTQSTGVAGEAAVFSLRLAQSDVQELRPWVGLMGNDPLKGVMGGRLGASLAVSIYGRGEVVDVAGKLESSGVMLRGEGSGRAGLVGPLAVGADWKSRLSDMKLLKLDSLTATIGLKGKQVGTLQAKGAVRIAPTTELTALTGAMKLSGLPGETLNPLISQWSQTRIGRAGVDGHADVVVDEGIAKWEVDFRGRDIQLRLPDARTDAPSIDLLVKQAGDFNRKTSMLRVDQLSVQVVEQRRLTVALSLDQPLTLSLAEDKKGDASKSGGSQEPITLGLRVNRLGVQQLRPWLVLVGTQALAPIRQGALDADLKVRLKGTDEIDVDGRLDLEEISIEREKKRPSDPVTLGTEVRAKVVDRSRVVVDSWTVRARHGKKLLAQLHLAGAAETAGATDLSLDVTASDLSELVGRLGLLTERQHDMISGGSLKGKVRVMTAGQAKPLTLRSAFRSDNLTIRLDKTHRMTRAIDSKVELDVDEARTFVELHRVEVTVESGGKKAGTLTASGRWPLADDNVTSPAGTVNVTLKELDSAPFVDFFGILPGRGAGPLPVNADIKFTQEPGGKTLAVQGKETVGPISVTVKGREPEPATLRLEHNLSRSGDEIKVGTFALTTERPKGRADRVALSGSFRTGVTPRVQLLGSVDAFDADWYQALVTPPSEQPSKSKDSEKKSATNGNETGFGVPLDLDIVLSIGTVVYRSLEIGKGRLIAKGDGQRMQATLEPTGIAGGSVGGTIIVALKGRQPEFSWNTKGEALDVGIISKALSGEAEPRIKGRGKFTSEGTGRGQGQALRQSLDGKVVFDVNDGEFVKSPVLEFLAEQTRIDDFKGLGFKTLHGELQIKEGWVKISQIRADGPAVAAEASGKVGLDGRLDVRVQPQIGPAFSDYVKIPCLDHFAKTAEGFTVLPVAVTVTGTAENPEYGATVEASSTVGSAAGAIVGTVAHVLTGCTGGEGAKKTTEEAVEAITEKATELIEGLLGGKKKK